MGEDIFREFRVGGTMAFLDDLKKEAQARKELELSKTQARTIEVTQSFLLVQSKLKATFLYLQELANHLNMVPLAPPRSYVIDGFGVIDDFRPEGYSVSTERFAIDEKEFISVINFRFRCKSEREIVIERDSPSLIEMQRDYLWQANLKFQCAEFKNTKGFVERATFRVTNEIPVHVRFTADFENARIFLFIKNFNGLTQAEFTYDANEVDEALLDEFAKYLVAKPNRFPELGRHQQALRQKVAARRNPQAQPGEEGGPQDQGGGKEGKKGLLGSIKSLFSS